MLSRPCSAQELNLGHVVWKRDALTIHLLGFNLQVVTPKCLGGPLVDHDRLGAGLPHCVDVETCINERRKSVSRKVLQACEGPLGPQFENENNFLWTFSRTVALFSDSVKTSDVSFFTPGWFALSDQRNRRPDDTEECSVLVKATDMIDHLSLIEFRYY
ncbi:hypothetical protein TNCV_2355471 [Trichonephila clavipes]|nr:hypothetical protein TNCV_2355471 [Trichonephila clavipes]